MHRTVTAHLLPGLSGAGGGWGITAAEGAGARCCRRAPGQLLLAHFASGRVNPQAIAGIKTDFRRRVPGSHLGQRAVQRAENKTVHGSAVAKTHLVFGGMYVHIHGRRVQFQIQDKGRVPAVIQHVPVGLLDRVGNQLVANHPTVDKKVLQVRLAAGKRRQAYPAPQPVTRHVGFDIQGLLHKSRAAHGRHPALHLGLATARFQVVNDFLVVAQTKAHVVARQGQPLHHFFEMVEFGLVRAQEFASCGCIEEQVAHFHRGAPGVWRRFDLHFHIPALAEGRAALAGIRVGIGSQAQPRYRADTGQGLAAKAQALYLFEILQGGNF